MNDSTSESNQELPRHGGPDVVFKKMAAGNNVERFPASSASKHSSSGNKTNRKGGKNATKMRFIVCSLGLMALAMSQMSRMVLNQCITLMVDPSVSAKSAHSEISTDGSCPWPEEPSQISPIIDVSTEPSIIDPIYYYLTAPSDWVDDLSGIDIGVFHDLITTTTMPPDVTEATFNTTDIKQERLDTFKWTIKQQSVLLGGFYYSYFFFMILGGRLAEVYGAKYVLMLAVAGSAVINLATPFMARNSYFMLVLSRILMGIIQSGVFPGMYALFNKWLTMSEMGIFTPLIKMNLRLGMQLGSLMPGLLPNWPSVYYFTGGLSALWCVAWFIVATSEPEGNEWVSYEELNHIMKKKTKPTEEISEEVELGERKMNGFVPTEKPKKKPSLKTPWLKIITAPSVIALIVVKLTFNYAIDFLAIEVPSYLRYVHHASKERISFITTFMYSTQVVLIVFVGWLAKSMVKRRPFGMTKTTVRKLFQGSSSFGMAFLMFLMTFNDCNIIVVGVILQLISFMSMFSAGGETMLPYDLSTEYPATIMAIANSVANLSGITTTVLVGLILGDQGGSYARWNILMYIIAGVNTFGGMTFLLLAKAEPIIVDSPKGGQVKNSKPTKLDIEQGLSETAPAPIESIAELPGRKEQKLEEKNCDDAKEIEPTEPVKQE